MNNLRVDDTGYRADICIETRLMSPTNPGAEVPHGNEGDGELPEEQDMVDDNLNGTSHHDNIDSDEEDIVLSELVKRLRDSCEHKTRATSDREHKEQSCSTSSNRNTRRGDETCGLGRETSQSEGKTTVIEKNSRTKSPQIDSTRATNSVNDSNSTAEVAPDKITVEVISGTRERFCKPNSKQKSKKNGGVQLTVNKSALRTQANSLAPRKEKSSKGASQTNGNNLKGDNSGSGTRRNSDIIAGKKDEYVGDVSKAKFRTKDNIFAFDVQTLELLWNFKGKWLKTLFKAASSESLRRLTGSFEFIILRQLWQFVGRPKTLYTSFEELTFFSHQSWCFVDISQFVYLNREPTW